MHSTPHITGRMLAAYGPAILDGDADASAGREAKAE